MVTKRLTLLCWVVMASLVFFSSFENQIVLEKDFKKTINLIFPEGWGFFTKNPREPQLIVYRLVEDDTIPLDMSNHSKQNYLGLSRKARIISYEASIYLNEIKQDKWIETTIKYLRDSKINTVVTLKKEYFRHIGKGEYIFSMFKPIPYAWAEQNQEQFNPIKVVKLIINESEGSKSTK